MNATKTTYRIAFPGQTGTDGLKNAKEVAREWRRLTGSQQSDYQPRIMGSDGHEYSLELTDIGYVLDKV